jgi:hypothetical protein
MAHGHRSGISRHPVILLSDTVEIRFSDTCGGIRSGQRRSPRSPLAVSTGLVIYVTVLLADLAQRSLLSATAYQNIVVPTTLVVRFSLWTVAMLLLSLSPLSRSYVFDVNKKETRSRD